jgi:hypothetical protein
LSRRCRSLLCEADGVLAERITTSSIRPSTKWRSGEVEKRKSGNAPPGQSPPPFFEKKDVRVAVSSAPLRGGRSHLLRKGGATRRTLRPSTSWRSGLHRLDKVPADDIVEPLLHDVDGRRVLRTAWTLSRRKKSRHSTKSKRCPDE